MSFQHNQIAEIAQRLVFEFFSVKASSARDVNCTTTAIHIQLKLNQLTPTNR